MADDANLFAGTCLAQGKDACNTRQLLEHLDRLAGHIGVLTQIGLALAGEQNRDQLLDMVVSLARDITGADAGTLYTVNDQGTALEFAVLQNDTLGQRQGGASGNPITLPPVPLLDEEGRPNHANVSSHVALAGKVVSIEDVYVAKDFDFSGARAYDKVTGYRSRSMLVIPLQNHETEVIGVLQLLNARSRKSGKPQAFSPTTLTLVQSLASQAAVALTNTRLIHDLKALLNSFMQSIAAAIDAKSPYTRGHIDRVAELTMRLAVAVNAARTGPFAQVRFSPDELEEIRLAAWMHDMGKISTPVRVVDKATRLEKLIDRMELVRERFWRIAQAERAEGLEHLLQRAEAGATPEELKAGREELERRVREIADDLDFLEQCNSPLMQMTAERADRVRAIAARRFEDRGESVPWLTEDEALNLCVPRGTLTDAERAVINNHICVTIDMLSRLHFPKRLARVPEIAGAHHEKLDGSGYPRGLSGDAISLPARILSVADVFEALTAKDRPYKEALPLATALDILKRMVAQGHLDARVVDLLVNSGVCRQYAEKHLSPGQRGEAAG